MLSLTPGLARNTQFLISVTRPANSHLSCSLYSINRRAYLHQDLNSRRKPRACGILLKPNFDIVVHSSKHRNFANESQPNSSNQVAPSSTAKATTAVAPSESPKEASDAKAKAEQVGAKTAVDLGGETVHKTNAEQRRADWRIVKKLSGNLWPKGWGIEARSTKSRVILALALLASGKVRHEYFKHP